MKMVMIKIYGRVQGVFFRMNAQKEAEKLNLVGWVKNEFDSSVLIEVRGEKENLDKFIQWCRQGSPSAKVEKINIQWKDDDKEYKKFEIVD